MFHFKVTLTNLDINEGEYTKALFDALEIQSRNAARAFLRAIILKVPVYTGMARGSFIPLGQFLHVAVPIHPVAFRKGHTPEIGATLSSFQFTRGFTTDFIFNEAVFHYLVNEFSDPRPFGIHLIHEPIPWFSFKAGKEAYRAYLKKYLKEKLPRLYKYMLRGVIKANGKQISISKQREIGGREI